MSRVLVGLLLSTVLPKFGTQQHLNLEQSPQHAIIQQKCNTKHQIANKFDKPSSIRLKIHSPRDTFSASAYKSKSIKGCNDLNAYNIFSNDWQSDRLRCDYEVWNSATFRAPLSEPKSHKSKRNPERVALSKAQYIKLVDSPENGPYVLDDDYSLMNYIDNWKGLDPDHKMRRFHEKSEKKLDGKKRHPKRDLEDKEFQVEFHSSRKQNEFRGKLVSSDEIPIESRRKLSMNHQKVKSHYRSKYDRSYGYFEPQANHFKSRSGACKKKRVLWGRKRAKVYPKLGQQSSVLNDLETRSRSNSAAMGHAWHWPTTRNYGMAAITPRKDFATPHRLEMVMMPQAPIHSALTDSVRKSLEAKLNLPRRHPLEFQNSAFVQKPLPRYIPTNLKIGLPANREVALALKPVLNQNSGNPTRRPSVFFNRPTEFINPYENHYEKFKNTPFWNARQGPPEIRGVIGSPVQFSNSQRFKMAPGAMQNGRFIKPLLSIPGFFQNISKDTGLEKFNDSFKIQKFKAHPVTKQEPVISTKQIFKALQPVDIVNLLQSALLPRTDKAAAITEGTPAAALPQSIPIEKMFDMIVPLRSTSISERLTKAPTEDDVRLATEEPKLIVDATKETLLSLFTTQEPLMESLEDILKRNTDRKIPIVYDIEDAPQLSPGLLPNPTTENPTEDVVSIAQDEHLTEPKSHILIRRGLLKKNKTSINHKTVQKTSANTTLTTPWIVLATTENMLYSEILEAERQKLNNTRKSKTRKATSRSKVNLLFKNKSKSMEPMNITTNEPPKATAEPNVRSKRGQNAVASSRSGKPNNEPDTSEPRCGKCQCGCHTTPRSTWCCRCRKRPPLELTTKASCCPASMSRGSISCPDCHQEFTYKLALRPLINC